MEHIYVNLKRFDIPPAFGGVNRISDISDWGRTIAANSALPDYPGLECVMFFPEAHLLEAVKASDGKFGVGCQGVHREDTAAGGNFGAFTTLRTANAMKAMGVSHVIIGHCEERKNLFSILSEGGAVDPEAVDRLLSKEVKAAKTAGLQVLFCVGETSEEQPRRDEVLARQLKIGLDGDNDVVIAYEPVWSIGPGKTPAGRDYIEDVSKLIKSVTGGADLVYGGGLKLDNAKMLASIPTINGGLIALTRFRGEIGFYPDEFKEIVKEYMSGKI
ncbi:MAG: triosephosphate isomerase [Clostridiales bacterium]|nr:triosephosphate isomerase [Clostridiales bacterium]